MYMTFVHHSKPRQKKSKLPVQWMKTYAHLHSMYLDSFWRQVIADIFWPLDNWKNIFDASHRKGIACKQCI